MADAVKIVVDGQNGLDVAQRSGIRHVDFRDANPNTALRLPRRGEIRDGEHGIRATRAIPGSPGGFLAVELFESEVFDEGLHVVVIDHNSFQRPPSEVEVPTQRDLFLSAVGGSGEPGHIGGDGEPGMDGTEGAPATRESDATPGTNGGRGGDAGEGSNGADGGDGGTIQIFVDEENIHLLLAVQWDLKGGQGGEPGRHGKPGNGGKGGPGGKGHKWSERVGDHYHCTSNCVGFTNSTSTTSTALTRVQGNLESGRMALLASAARAQAVQGGNLQAMIAQVAARYGAMRSPPIHTGACRCAGGTGNCVGCGSTPVYKDFARQKGPNGRDGQPGTLSQNPLVPGVPGHHGGVSIVVRSSDGGQTEYPSKFNLELLEFEVEDENGDGIFEPGEHIIVRRIRIRNSGGMPSPTCPIPITAVSSAWFSPVTGEEGRTYISSSIPAGVSVTLDGFMKVLIRQADDPPPPGKLFLERDTLSVQATMPWLNRKLKGFTSNKAIDIQYPVELQKIKFLPTLAQGSRSNVTWETFNKGVIPLGAGAPSLRPIEIDAVIASNSGALLSPAQEWLESVVNEVEILPPKGSVPTKQMLRISTEAKSYQQVVLHLRLYIAVPSSDHSTDDNNMVAIQLVQQCELLIQVSPHHKYNPMADFLLVTNPATTHHHVQAIRTFITDNLNMEVDEWNIGLYGGLSYTAEEGEAATESVLATYRSKTIIFMGNRFEFFNSGTRRITQLCDAQALAENCLHGTSLLFLGSLSDQNYDRLLKNILFPIPFNVASTADGVVPSKSFATKRDLVKSINQQKFIASPAFTAYKLPLKTRWYRFGRASSKAETKAAAKYLRRHLPQDRFLVSSCDSGTSAPGLVVLHGNAHQATVIATESQSLDAVGRPAAPSESAPQPGAANGLVPPSITYPINLQELFLVVASIPISKRIDVAWSDHGSNGTSGIGYSMFALKAVILSLQTDINREVQALLSRGGWPSKLPPAREKHDIPSFLRLHLPILGAVLAHPSAFTADPLPTDLVSLLKHAEASCLPQSKRQVLKSSVVPLSRRQSQLHSLVASAITALLTRKLMTKRDIRLHHHKVRKELHSNFSSEKRNVENMLVRTGSEFTGRTEHEYVESCKTASQLVPKTEYCKGDEWDSRLRAEREVMERVEREYEDARGILGRMILEA